MGEAEPHETDDRAAPRRSKPRRLGRMIGLAVGMLLTAALGGSWALMVRMPGRSYHGPLKPLTASEVQLRDDLRRHVEELAVNIGERNSAYPEGLARAGAYIETELQKAGFTVKQRPFEAHGRQFINYEAQIEATTSDAPVIVVGAHYDSATGTPAANDNGSGVAALLELAKMARRPAKSPSALRAPPLLAVRYVAFANEEPPHFQTPAMGSLAYAKQCRDAGDQIVAMLSLETMGYYRDEPGTQSYPFPMSLLYPSVGNFVAFVGDLSSRGLVREMVGSFRSRASFPSEGAALPASIPGVGWSDHWSFWQHGVPAVMVTDTAPFRYPHYHTAQDTPDKIDFDRLARVVSGLGDVVRVMADPDYE
jgi:hypothetical protein